MAGVWTRGTSKKNLGPLHIFATAEASNFKFGTQLGFETTVAYQKTTFGPKLAEVWAREHPKKLGPLRIFATVEASNFKFGTQIGFGTSLPENNVLDQNWRGSGLGEHPKKIWKPALSLLSETKQNIQVEKTMIIRYRSYNHGKD